MFDRACPEKRQARFFPFFRSAPWLAGAIPTVARRVRTCS